MILKVIIESEKSFFGAVFRQISYKKKRYFLCLTGKSEKKKEIGKKCLFINFSIKLGGYYIKTPCMTCVCFLGIPQEEKSQSEANVKVNRQSPYQAGEDDCKLLDILEKYFRFEDQSMQTSDIWESFAGDKPSCGAQELIFFAECCEQTFSKIRSNLTAADLCMFADEFIIQVKDGSLKFEKKDFTELFLKIALFVCEENIELDTEFSCLSLDA